MMILVVVVVELLPVNKGTSRTYGFTHGEEDVFNYAAKRDRQTDGQMDSKISSLYVYPRCCLYTDCLSRLFGRNGH